MRLRLIVLAPVLAFVTLAAWALSSPVGSSPDDDHHLISIWCAAEDSSTCLPGTDPLTRVVPKALDRVSCYAFDPEESAACQTAYLEEGFTPDTLTGRGDFAGAYPPVYFKAMSVFAGPGLVGSALTMRLVTIALFVGLTTLLFILLPLNRRPTLIWGWLLTTMPLGLFLIASTNPSGWAITGVGTAWLALLGYFETAGRRRLALGGLFLVAVVMAAGSRGDAAFYILAAIAAVVVLTIERKKSYLIASVVPLIGAVIAIVFIASAQMVSSGVEGFSGDATPGTDPRGAASLSSTSLLAYNALNLPFLWSGVFGGWGLGWLDTSLPTVVLWTAAGCFIALGFMGLSRMDRRKALALAGIGTLLVVLPLYVLQKGHDAVGANVQPRYILPLIVLFGGLLMLEPADRPLRFTRLQLLAVAGALSVANFVALETNIRRYVTGTDEQGFSLDAGREWWWDMPIGANVVWLVGSLSFAGLVVILLREIALRPSLATAQEPQALQDRLGA